MKCNNKFDIDEVVSGFFFIELDDVKQDDVLHTMWLKIKNFFSNNP